MQASRDIARLIEIMAALRTPGTGCPWDLRAGFRDHRSLHAGGSLRGRRRHRARRSRRPARGAWRSAAAGRLSRPHGAGARRLRFRRRGAGDHRKAVAAAPARVRRRARPRARRGRQALGPHQGRGKGRKTECPRRRRGAARWPGVPVGLPALTRALKLQQKASKVGFDWNDPMAVLAKIREEADEIEADLGPASASAPAPRLAISCSRSSISRATSMPIRSASCAPPTGNSSAVSPRSSARLAARGKTPAQSTLAEMDALWDAAKAAEK